MSLSLMIASPDLLDASSYNPAESSAASPIGDPFSSHDRNESIKPRTTEDIISSCDSTPPDRFRPSFDESWVSIPVWFASASFG